MCRTDDPLKDFDRWDAEREARLARLPICCECGDPIQQDDVVCINDCLICDDCLNQMRVDIGGDD